MKLRGIELLMRLIFDMTIISLTLGFDNSIHFLKRHLVFGWYNFPSGIEISNGKSFKRYLNAPCFSRYFLANKQRVWWSSFRTDIIFLYFFFCNDVAIVLHKTYFSEKPVFIFMNCCTLSVPYFLADSSAFIILPGISEPTVIFCATPWKGLFKLPISPAIYS